MVQSLVTQEKTQMTPLSDNGKGQPEDGDIVQDTRERLPDDLVEDESQSADSGDVSERKCDSEVIWEIHHNHREGLFGKTEDRQEDMRVLTAQWREERVQYPNWFILPAKLKDKVRMYNQCEELLQCEDLLPLSEQLEFAYELLWRYETAMLSYSVFLQHHAYRIWRSVMEENDWSEKEKNMKWFQIGLFLLREYREDLNDGQWETVYCELKQHTDFTDFGEQHLAMEEIALSFTSMNISKTVMLLNSYQPPKPCFDIRLRLCGIKAECGLLEAVRQDVEMLGQDIRTQIISGKLSGQGDRVYLKSILPCVLHLKSFIETVSIISSDQSCGMAYSFYRVLEKSGLPLSLGHVRLLGQHCESMVYTSIARNALEILKRLSSVATLPQQNQLIHLMIKLINKNAIKEFRALGSSSPATHQKVGTGK